MEEYSVIGKRLPRVDGIPMVTGEAKYTGDMVIPGMLHGKILRSPHTHAKILNIDVGKAQRLKGVKGIVTGKDTLGVKFGFLPVAPETMDEPLLAMEKVRYIGEPIAAVAAVDEDTALEALDLIEVEYEPLPSVFDPLEAMKPDAPMIHDKERNVCTKFLWNFGDVDKGFEESYHVREDRFMTQAIQHCATEPHAAIASFDRQGNLTLWSSTQTPYRVSYGLSKTLEICTRIK